MKTDLKTLGDATWHVDVISEEKILEPSEGFLLTVKVRGGDEREHVVFFPARRPRPEVGKRARIRFHGGELTYPVRDMR